MNLVKSTKGTHVYADLEDGAPVKQLYINRDALPSPPPAEIRLIIETVDGARICQSTS